MQACKEANIYFCRDKGQIFTDLQQISIGINNNQDTQILSRYGGLVEHDSVPTPGVLSCTEFRWFWVSWVDGGTLLSVGTGKKRGDNVLIQKYIDDTRAFNINAIGLHTDFRITDASWEVHNYDGTYIHSLSTIGI